MKPPPRPTHAVADRASVLPPWHLDGRGGSVTTLSGGGEALVVQRPAWITGECWRCDRADLPVMWLGPVQSEDHGQGPFYACDPCVRRLEARIAEFAARRDLPE